jgi:hypothetical protein
VRFDWATGPDKPYINDTSRNQLTFGLDATFLFCGIDRRRDWSLPAAAPGRPNRARLRETRRGAQRSQGSRAPPFISSRVATANLIAAVRTGTNYGPAAIDISEGRGIRNEAEVDDFPVVAR